VHHDAVGPEVRFATAVHWEPVVRVGPVISWLRRPIIGV
jgi:hypothetical protein